MLVLKTKALPCLHGGLHLQLPLEQIVEVNRGQYCEQHSEVGKRTWQSSALVSPTKTVSEEVAPVGYDSEPIEDVEMRCVEEEETLDTDVSRARLNSKKPTSREKQEHDGSGFCCLQKLVSRLLSKVVESEDNIE